MAKKNAKKEATGGNWQGDAEEEGTFSLASEDVLRNRTIKRAKRRHARPQSDGKGTSKGIKNLAVPSGRGEFGGGPGEKPQEVLTTRRNRARAAVEPKAAVVSVTANEPPSLEHVAAREEELARTGTATVWPVQGQCRGGLPIGGRKFKQSKQGNQPEWT